MLGRARPEEQIFRPTRRYLSPDRRSGPNSPISRVFGEAEGQTPAAEFAPPLLAFRTPQGQGWRSVVLIQEAEDGPMDRADVLVSLHTGAPLGGGTRLGLNR